MKRLFLLLFCVLLVSCTSSSNKEKEVPLYLGTEGVVLSFPEQNKFQLYESDVFSIALRVENKGASHVTDDRPGYVSAVFDPAVFALTTVRTPSAVHTKDIPAQVPFSLLGRDKDVNVGELDYLDFTFKVHSVAGNRDDVQSTITFQACYPYNTTFIQNICVDRDVFNTEASKSCLNHALTGTSQGAPVAVTKVDQSYLRQGNSVMPRFKIQLRNLQQGYTLWNSTVDTRQACSQQDFGRSEFGRVYVQAFLNNVPLKCGTEPDYNGIARFDGAETEIVCRHLEGVTAGANYQTPFVVIAQYFYISSLPANVEVENVEQ